jgi:hypothetical protein
VNVTIGSVVVRSGAYTNTIESTWRYVKAFLNRYNRMGDYFYHLAHYMFAAKCRSEDVDQFAMFIGTVN